MQLSGVWCLFSYRNFLRHVTRTTSAVLRKPNETKAEDVCLLIVFHELIEQLVSNKSLLTFLSNVFTFKCLDFYGISLAEASLNLIFLNINWNLKIRQYNYLYVDKETAQLQINVRYFYWMIYRFFYSLWFWDQQKLYHG